MKELLIDGEPLSFKIVFETNEKSQFFVIISEPLILFSFW